MLPALIALNAATDVWHPLRGLQRVTAGVADRPLHAGEISAADVGLGSGTAGQLGRQQSFEPGVGLGAIERPPTEVQPSLDAAVHE